MTFPEFISRFDHGNSIVLLEGKRNVLVVTCDTWEQAAAIEKAAHDRSDMQRVEICLKPPRERSGVLYSRKHFSDFAGDWLAYYRGEAA
jgi:hypothetical protein